MKKSILILILSTSLFASESFFKQEDKQQHIQVTALISLMTSSVAHEMGYTTTQSFWIGVASALAVGLGKELYDSRKSGTGFSGEDMMADGIGGTLGALPVFVFYQW
jgi:putative lipoprotein